MWRAVVVSLILSDALGLRAQTISNGVGVVTRDTVRVLIVFAEVDYDAGPCPSDLKEDFNGTWPTDRGRTLVPTFAPDFFDFRIEPGRQPSGLVTRYYHQASFGAYVMLGDYMPHVVTVPCSKLRVGSNGVDVILGMLAEQGDGLQSARGLPMQAFDLWTAARSGQPKTKGPDGRVDLLYVVWRNNRMITGSYTQGCSGYGVSGHKGIAFGGMEGISNMASFNVAESADCAEFITVAEHLHGIFGGNNWHSTGGRGTHTFLAPPSSYGLTGQFSATMRAPSGWDRWMMEWRNPAKKFLISAFDANNRERDTETLTQDNGPDGGTYILRDFMTTGDAIRIKLPYIDWKKRGDVKNQYLWLENRRMKGGIDRYIQNDCSNSGKFPNGTPGIYAYIQVGKDQKEGKDIHSADVASPNGLASPFWPITAEGNFDIAYRMDLIQEADHSMDCNWGNRNVPADPSLSLPNPFTGHNDLYGIVDVNDDGVLYNDEKLGIGLSKVRNGTVVNDYHTNGDWLDAFAEATGKMEMAIWTNPAPVPVYTYATDYENRRCLHRDSTMQGYENRTVHLNGLWIRFRELKAGEMEVQIRWDSFTLKDDVRWCGDIQLHQHPFVAQGPSLIIPDNVKLNLARGTSPQYHMARSTDRKGNHLFTDPTRLRVGSAAVMVVESGGEVLVNDDSELHLNRGARLVLESGSKLIIGPKAKLTLADGAIIEEKQGSQIIRKKK
jgi:hypothetical protein